MPKSRRMHHGFYDPKLEKDRERCGCARCMGLPTADPKYGYDRSKVPAVHCLYCETLIGEKPFVEITMVARFGQIMFAHKSCAKKAKVKK